MDNKFIRVKETGTLARVVVGVLAVCEVISLEGYSQCLEGIRLRAVWWMGDYLRTSLIRLTIFIVLASLVSRDDDFMLDTS